MIDLVVNRKVDVVNMSIGGLPALNDGNNARAILYTRLINDYGVQFFISAGNSGPGLNTVGDPSVATDVVSVAASISKDTWRANYGSEVRASHAVFPFSSRGPREDGGLKPNITAPGAAISTTPAVAAGQRRCRRPATTCHPGYQMLNGTSMAAPQATGAAALLLSAAKATGRTVSPAALRRALYSSATWIDGAPAHSQGYGLVNVPGAWQLLRTGRPAAVIHRGRPGVHTDLRAPRDPAPRPGRLQPVPGRSRRAPDRGDPPLHGARHPHQRPRPTGGARVALGRQRRHLPRAQPRAASLEQAR